MSTLVTKRIAAAAAAVVVLAGFAAAQAPLPDTIWVPVIFYDYKADQTNPNFEPAAYSDAAAGLKPGMVQRHLSSERKPLFAANLCFNDRVAEWFVPSNRTSNSIFQYNAAASRWEWTNLANYSGRPTEWVSQSYSATDPMANIVIYEQLPFTLTSAATGTYEFVDPAFFPLDGRGFGAQPATYPTYGWTNTANNNFGFAMELHHEFVFRSGLTFNFTGDDDVWAFINDSLVMDLGGIHGAENGSINLSSLGLVDGQRYHFDFFYCERHVTQSSIRITTNLVAPVTVESLHVAAQPPVARITAGDSVKYTVTVYVDSAGVVYPKPAYAQLVSWTATGSTANPSMSQDSGAASTFYGQRAWTDYTITASIRDPVTGRIITKTMTVRVDPGPPDHIVIEPDNTPDYWTPQPLDVMTLPVGVNADTAWAVARDRYNNLVSAWQTQSIVWRSVSETVARVTGGSAQPAEGTIARGVFAAPTDSTLIIASLGTARPDTLRVMLLNRLACATPVAVPPGTTFTGTITVTLSTATQGADIWYCFNCTAPSAGGAGSVRYTGPITITQNDTTTLKAIAVKSGCDPSGIMVERYINDRDVSGPVITKAFFYLGNPPGSGGGARPDTLIIWFSEPTRFTDVQDLSQLENALNYIDSTVAHQEGVALSGATVLSSADSFVDHIVVVMPGGAQRVSPGEDSVQLEPGSVHDRWGNGSPDSPPTVAIKWGREYPPVISVSANPFRIGQSTASPVVSGLHFDQASRSRNGEPPVTNSVVLLVTSVQPVDEAHSSMKVYDAVGNLVRGDVPCYGVEVAGVQDTSAFFWDGRNRNDRLVGAGTYLAVVQVKQVDGKSKLTNQKIGVMR